MKKSYFYSATALTAALVVAVPAQASFQDVKAGTEQAEAIQSLVDRQIISGYSDGTFKPSNTITRAQAAKILTGVLKLDIENVTDPGFTDVPKTDAYYKYIAALANEGIINGSNGKYRPNDSLSRGQMAKILANSFKLTGNKELPFTDTAKSIYAEYVEVLYANNITTGKTATTFGVNDSVTRGQLAVFIKRIEDLQNEQTVEYTSKEFGYKYIDATSLELISDGAVKIQAGYEMDHKKVVVTPVAEGVDYFFLGDYDPEDYNDDMGELKYFKAEVVEKDGMLHMTVTQLDEPVYEPGVLSFRRDQEIELTDLAGRVLDKSLYEIKDGEVWKEVYVNAEGEYLVKSTKLDGTVEQHGMSVYIEHPYTFTDWGHYIVGDTYVITNDLEELYGEMNITDISTGIYQNGFGETSPESVKAELVGENIVLKIIGTGISLLNIDAEFLDHEFAGGVTVAVNVKSFGSGYLLRVYE